MTSSQKSSYRLSGQLGAGLLALLREWRRRYADRCALAALCNRSLRDIGLTSYDVAYEAAKPFWRS